MKEGEGIGGETPPPPAVKEKAEPETPSSDYQAFVDAWFHAYKEVTDGGYLFNKRYDPAAVKSLLTLKQPPVEIIRLAVWAWKNNDSYCQKKASSIHGFCEHYPELLAESKMPPKTMSPSARKAVQDGIKTVREAMLKLPANPESTLFSASRVLTPSQITEFKDMRQKLADLERQITA